METTLNKCISMMEYMDILTFVIPHHNLPLPEQAEGIHYRAEKTFRLIRYNGKIHYRGWGCAPDGMKMDVNTYGINPPDQWIERAYLYLIDDVKNKVIRRTKTATMKNVGSLILRFNGLSFVELGCE
jgi:hypothetical protein